MVELVRVAVTVDELQCGVYKAAIDETLGAVGALALHTLPTAPPGRVPLKVGATVSFTV